MRLDLDIAVGGGCDPARHGDTDQSGRGVERATDLAEFGFKGQFVSRDQRRATGAANVTLCRQGNVAPQAAGLAAGDLVKDQIALGRTQCDVAAAE